MKPDLKIVKLPTKKKSPIRDHLDEVAKTSFNDPDPVVGYAVVLFHKNGAYRASYHVTEAKIHQVDLPDKVRNRLMETVINNMKA